MLLPGSKGWINKYFSLIEEGEVSLNYAHMNGITAQHHLHLLSGKTGIVFGYASRFLFFLYYVIDFLFKNQTQKY